MDTRKTYPIPAPGVDVLRTLAREVASSDLELQAALNAHARTTSRNAAVQSALCAALGIPQGTNAALDLVAGCFATNETVQAVQAVSDTPKEAPQ